MPSLTPIDKLPLVTRKSIRDDFEVKRPEYESKMKKLVHEDWTIDWNPNLVYMYAEEDYQRRLGSVFTWYLDGWIDGLESFVKQFGEDGITELNTVCPNHKLIFGPQGDDATFSYGGLLVKDQSLHLVFNDKALGSNAGYICDKLGEALNNAPKQANASVLNVLVRRSIATEYDPEIDPILKRINAQLGGEKSVTLDPNWEENATVLSKTEQWKKDDWEKRIGYFTLQYFEAVAWALNQKKFKDDDMLQEGFWESIEKGEIKVQVLPKWPDDRHRYNELKIEDGTLLILTSAEYFATNIDYAVENILDIL